MLSNVLHDIYSIKHKLIQNQILFDEISIPFLYDNLINKFSIERHNLYSFSKQLKKRQ